jgi:hypothetical protein
MIFVFFQCEIKIGAACALLLLGSSGSFIWSRDASRYYFKIFESRALKLGLYIWNFLAKNWQFGHLFLCLE